MPRSPKMRRKTSPKKSMRRKKSPKKSRRRLRGGAIEFLNGFTTISSGLGSDMEWEHEFIYDSDTGVVRDTIKWTAMGAQNYIDPSNIEALGFLNLGGIPYQLDHIDAATGDRIFTRQVPNLQFLIDTLHHPANPIESRFNFCELEPWTPMEMEDDEVIEVPDEPDLRCNDDNHCRIVVEHNLIDYRCTNGGDWAPGMRYA